MPLIMIKMWNSGVSALFLKKLKEKYSVRNPKTGEIIYVPERNKVRFKASKNLTKLSIDEKIKNFYSL